LARTEGDLSNADSANRNDRAEHERDDRERPANQGEKYDERGEEAPMLTNASTTSFSH
jgi:hypothetical protein